MNAKLLGLYSPDVDIPLDRYIPEQKDNFCFLATMLIGEETVGGEETFDIIVCTPQWLINNHSVSDIIIGRHYLIVFEYNYKRIVETLQKIVENSYAETWDEIALKIGRVGRWEFEDYHEKE